MPLERWNPLDEIIYSGNEMDPVFEDALARSLDEWTEIEGPILLPLTGEVNEAEDQEDQPEQIAPAIQGRKGCHRPNWLLTMDGRLQPCIAWRR